MSRFITLKYKRKEAEVQELPDSFEEFINFIVQEFSLDPKVKLCLEYIDINGDKNIITKSNYSPNIIDELRETEDHAIKIEEDEEDEEDKDDKKAQNNEDEKNKKNENNNNKTIEDLEKELKKKDDKIKEYENIIKKKDEQINNYEKQIKDQQKAFEDMLTSMNKTLSDEMNKIFENKINSIKKYLEKK